MSGQSSLPEESRQTTSDTEIRHLPPHVLSRIANILDYNDSWKDLASIIPHPDSAGVLLLTTHDIRVLEEDKLKSSNSPTQALLQYWGTYGRNRPRVGHFIDLVTSCGHLRVAKYLTVDVLGQDPPTVESICILKEGVPTFGNPSVVNPGEDNSSTTLMNCGVPHYPYSTLEMATLGFCEKGVNMGGRLLGEGGFGAVYLGVMNDNTKVAVKKLKDFVGTQFDTELQVLTRFEHPNLLPLVGYSVNGPSTCLVYEYLSKGSLQQCLASQDNPLLWTNRLSIAAGTARGINHLHVHGEKPLVHRDIKSANILLDANLVPKLGDFGLAHRGSAGTSSATVVVTSVISGTSPYMAPEAFRGDVSAKMDVFSFGVVLLELLTSLPPYDANREDMDLLSHIQENCKDICELLDAKAGLWNTDSAISLYKVSLKCTKDSKRERPSMAEVIPLLEELCSAFV